MRGLTQAAAVLCLSLTSALVIPPLPGSTSQTDVRGAVNGELQTATSESNLPVAQAHPSDLSLLNPGGDALEDVVNKVDEWRTSLSNSELQYGKPSSKGLDAVLQTDRKPSFSDQYLKPSINAVDEAGKAIKQKLSDVVRKLGQYQKVISSSQPAVSYQNDGVEVLYGDEIQEDEAIDTTTPTSEPDASTTTILSHSAAETRSLTEAEEYLTASTTLPYSATPEHHVDGEVLKIIGISLLLLSLFSWFLLRCRDPRWRVDRAARREERNTKRLYRRAARQQKIKNWIWSFRMKYKLASPEVLRWDEKRNRVAEQESVLESVLTQDIRALRRAHRIVSDVTAAEEGQNTFEYEVEGSRRRDSVSTLPGYRSDCTDPPPYNGLNGARSRSAVGDGDSDPASSVVSTSPRISQEGTNSDFDEKIETLSLDPRGLPYNLTRAQ